MWESKTSFLVTLTLGLSVLAMLAPLNVAKQPVESESSALVVPKQLGMRLLSAQAKHAAQRDARPEAEVLAAAALAFGSGPEVRGLLASFDVYPRLRLRRKHDLTSCERAKMSRSGAFYMCWKEASVRVYDAETGLERWRHDDVPESLTVLEKSGHIVARYTDHTFVSHLEKSNQWIREIPSFVDGPFSTTASAIGWNQSLLVIEPEEGRVQRLGVCVSSIDPAISSDEQHIVSLCSRTSYSRVAGTAVTTHVFTSNLAHPAAAITIDSSGDNAYLIDVRGRLSVVSLDDGAVHTLSDTGIRTTTSLELSPNQRRLMIGASSHGVSLYSALGQRLTRLPQYYGDLAAFRANGELTTIGGSAFGVWTVPKEIPARILLPEMQSEVAWAVLSPTGMHVINGTSDGRHQIVSRTLGTVLSKWDGASGVTSQRVSWSPDGKYVATGSPSTDTLQVMTRNAEVTAVKPMLAAKQIEWMKDDRLVVMAGNDSIMQVFRGEALFQMNVCDERRWLDMSSSPNKGVLAILDETHVLYTMTPADECPVNRTKVPNMDLIAVDNSGMNAVAAHANQVVRLSLAGDSILPLEVGDNRIEDVALSPSGEWVVASTESGSVLVWNSQQTAPFAQLTAHRERVSALQFNAESAQLMTASGRAGIRFWSFSIFDQSEELLRQKLNTAYRLALEDVIPPFPQ